MCFYVSLDYFGFILLVLLGLGFSVSSQEIGWEEHLQNDFFVSSGMQNLALFSIPRYIVTKTGEVHLASFCKYLSFVIWITHYDNIS